MELKEIIRNYTHNIIDLTENKWKVIEVSDIEEICKEYHKQQLNRGVVVGALFCEDCQKWVDKKCTCGNTELSLDYTE